MKGRRRSAAPRASAHSRKENMRKAIVLVILLAGLGTGGYYWWRYYSQEKAKAEQPKVVTAKVENGPLRQTVLATGIMASNLDVDINRRGHRRDQRVEALRGTERLARYSLRIGPLGPAPCSTPRAFTSCANCAPHARRLTMSSAVGLYRQVKSAERLLEADLLKPGRYLLGRPARPAETPERAADLVLGLDARAGTAAARRRGRACRGAASGCRPAARARP